MADTPPVAFRALAASIKSPMLSNATGTPSPSNNSHKSSGSDETTKRSSSLATIDEDTLPALDRTVDLQAFTLTQASQSNLSDKLVPPVSGTGQLSALFTKLNVDIRLHIYELLLPPSDGKKVTLSPAFATKDIFPEDHFLVPDEVLWPAYGAIEACRQLRHEITTFFWKNYSFHVTLSHFTAPFTSPQSQKWLMLYASHVQHLTIECDLTRMGLGASRDSQLLSTSTEKIRIMIERLVAGLRSRADGSTLEDLHLLCRRYHGFRPPESDEFNTKGELPDLPPGLLQVLTVTLGRVPYCPEEATFVCDSVMELGGMIKAARMSGFPRGYTNIILTSLFGYGENAFYEVPSVPAWPPLIISEIDPATAIFSSLPSSGKSYSSGSNYTSDPAPSGIGLGITIDLTRSRSFTEEFEKEIARRSEHHILQEEDEDDNNNETFTPRGEQIMSKFPSTRSTSRCDAIESTTPRPTSTERVATSQPPSYIAARSTSLALAQFDHFTSGNPDDPVTSPNRLRSTSLVVQSTDTAFSSPKTPNAMNCLNEQDPAFVRSFNALQLGGSSLNAAGCETERDDQYSNSISDINNLERVVESERSYSSMSGRARSEGGMRRYQKFIGKLKDKSLANDKE